MISSLFDQGGQFLNVPAASVVASTYPSDGVGGATNNPSSSILADAKSVCILSVVFRTSSQTGVFSILRHSDGANILQNMGIGTANSGSRSVDFGPIGLLVDGGFYVTQSATAPAITVVYKKIS